MKQHFLLGLTLVTGLALAASGQQVEEGPVTTRTVVAAETHGAILDPAQITLKINGKPAPISDVSPIRPAGTEVAILIDDGVRSGFDLQIKDLATFIEQMPPNTRIFLGYMQNGTVREGTRDGFTTDRESVVSQLRVSLSNPGVAASPYFSLSTFVKNWPSNRPAARFVLLITNGIDPYNGRPSVLNQDSPYVQTAQDDAVRAGVAVSAIYYPQAGMRGGSFSGQDYLSQVAQATGGQLLNSGSIPPVSFTPYLKEFQQRIAESYMVSFQSSARKEKRDTLDNIKLSTSQHGVKLFGPSAVHPGN